MIEVMMRSSLGLIIKNGNDLVFIKINIIDVEILIYVVI